MTATRKNPRIFRAPESPAHIPAPGAVCRLCAHLYEKAGTAHFSDRAYCNFNKAAHPPLCTTARFDPEQCGKGQNFSAARAPAEHTEQEARAYLNTPHVQRADDAPESKWIPA